MSNPNESTGQQPEGEDTLEQATIDMISAILNRYGIYHGRCAKEIGNLFNEEREDQAKRIAELESRSSWREIAKDGLPGEGDEDDQFLLFHVERRHVFAMRSRRYVHAYVVLTKAAYTHWREIELPTPEN